MNNGNIYLMGKLRPQYGDLAYSVAPARSEGTNQFRRTDSCRRTERRTKTLMKLRISSAGNVAGSVVKSL